MTPSTTLPHDMVRAAAGPSTSATAPKPDYPPQRFRKTIDQLFPPKRRRSHRHGSLPCRPVRLHLLPCPSRPILFQSLRASLGGAGQRGLGRASGRFGLLDGFDPRQKVKTGFDFLWREPSRSAPVGQPNLKQIVPCQKARPSMGGLISGRTSGHVLRSEVILPQVFVWSRPGGKERTAS